MITKYVKKYISPINYIIEQHRQDGVIRQLPESNMTYIEWLKDEKNILEIIPFITEAPKKIDLEELKILKKKDIVKWYEEETKKPLKVRDNPPVYIKQTESDLNLWEKGIKGFLLVALEQGYFNGANALTPDEISDLLVGTIRGSVITKAQNYSVSPIDYYGKPVFISLKTMTDFTLKLAAAFQYTFLRFHLLINFVDYAKNEEMLKYLTAWNTDLTVYGYPSIEN